MSRSVFRAPLRSLAGCSVITLALGLSLAPTAPAQTGPYQDGELLLESIVGGVQSLRRLVPETGASAALVTGVNFAFTPGSLVFDPFRGGVVASLSLPPDGALNYKPWVIAHDGGAVALPGLVFTALRAMCPTGEGQLFFQRADGSATAIEYYDAGNQLHTLLDVGGVTPFALKVEHMLYDAAGNALIATVSYTSFGTSCQFGLNSVYRIPLSLDRTQVQGAVTCASWLTQQERINGLDALPGGFMLITLDSSLPNVDGRIALVDPSGPGVSAWASPGPTNLRGGCYSTRLGQAVVFDDFFSVLRAYDFAGTGNGQVLVVDTPFDQPTGGPNAVERMIDIDVLGPACDGFHATYGAGLAGSAGFVPKLAALGCPDVGDTFSVIIDDVLGAAPGIIFAGLSQIAVPFKGGTFLVGGIALQLGLQAGGVPGDAGGGDLAFPVLLDLPVFIGVDLFVQAGFADAGAVHGASLTNGLRIQAG